MKEGIIIGYNEDGVPKSVAVYGGMTLATRRDAIADASAGGLMIKEYERGSEEAEAEIERLRANL